MDKEEFKKIVNEKIHRDGIGDLMGWLENTDFYTAPASTKYHGAYEGGLLEHSTNVYMRLQELAKFYDVGCSEESIAICGLFHDLCKVNFYKIEKRWRKNKLQKWEQYPVYVKDEQFPFGGHGSKSVYLIHNFMKLEPEEAAAINSHMGAWDNSPYQNPGDVYGCNKLAWVLHVADEAATYLNGC
jgi:HD superfamily phosphohydrolase YqeK